MLVRRLCTGLPVPVLVEMPVLGDRVLSLLERGRLADAELGLEIGRLAGPARCVEAEMLAPIHGLCPESCPLLAWLAPHLLVSDLPEVAGREYS